MSPVPDLLDRVQVIQQQFHKEGISPQTKLYQKPLLKQAPHQPTKFI